VNQDERAARLIAHQTADIAMRMVTGRTELFVQRTCEGTHY
jgi:hypothetical protein